MVAEKGHLIYAKDFDTVNITNSGSYRLHYRGVNKPLKVVIAPNINVFISEKFCRRAAMQDITFEVGTSSQMILSSFSDFSSKISHNINVDACGEFSGYFGNAGKRVNNEWNIKAYKGSNAVLNISALCKGSDLHTYKIVTHQTDGENNIDLNCRGVAIDEAICKFTTVGKIDKGCSGAVAYHKSKILTLSDTAQAYVDPSLYIDEYDVKAGHSGSVGRVDKEAMFYLMSRGLSAREVIKLVAEGFLLESIQGYLITPDRKNFNDTIAKQVDL